MNPGDVVRLKSGGPRMTVKYVKRDRSGVIVKYFEKDRLRSADFTFDEIEIAHDEPPPPKDQPKA